MLLDIGETVLKIFDVFNFSDERRNLINLAKGGGGNPAKIWLENLQQNYGDITSEEFNNALFKCHLRLPESRRKEDESPNFHFVSDLTRQNIDDLSSKFSEESDWRSVASELNYRIEKIEQMHPNRYCCADVLFEIIGQEKPEYSVKEFMILLKRLNINNAYNQMKETVKECANKKLSTK